MNKFYKIKFDPNKRYLLKICSLEKRYIYFRDNFKRVCIENHKLKKENEKLLTEISKLQCDYRQLEEFWEENK